MLRKAGIGLCMVTSTPSAQIVAAAREADRLDFHSFWVAEGSHNFRASGEPRSATSVAAAVAVATSRITIGLGIISAYTRHPVVMAQEALALAELSNDRFVLGLGATKNAMMHMGRTAETLKPVAVHREAVALVRALLSGDKVDYAGKIFQMDAPPRKTGETPFNVPIALAATGPRMLQLSGAIADVVLLPPFTTPAFVRYAREEMAKGAATTGRNPDDIIIGAPLHFAVDADGKLARDRARPLGLGYIASKAKTADTDKVTQLAGLSAAELEPIARKMAAEGQDAGLPMVSDALLAKIAIAGTPEECAARLKEYRDAGMGMPLLSLTAGGDSLASLRVVAEKIAPGFAA